ncbi:sodium/hydrogen exchanger 2 [Electrophorus electricus]|uniref:sodium/hydrogen exchanger 2 n=1 Tax=Electrophorus electricus TaxID=8005 RepID=UPI0015D02CC2|nr:sodium/hydrogen exchanger 2 [Electrophorus electricus]
MGFLFYSRAIFGFFIWCSILSLFGFGANAVLSQKRATSPQSDFTTRVSKDDGPQTFPEPEGPSLPVFTLNYPRIQIPFEITLWVLLASFAKIGFHVYHKITIWVPETCLLITIGLIVGAIMHSVHERPPAVLTSSVFFLYMLPPIVLDSAYFMPTSPFFENLGTVMWFSVVGTLWNSIGVGVSLFGVCQIPALGAQDISLQENLLFASIVSAVDPVAALAVFEDVNVNEQLYIVVFGESLFNDAVTVVLYNLFNHVAELPVVDAPDVFLAVVRFFVVGLGGILLGVLFGFVAAFTTRFTRKVREIEPLFIFMYSYLAYLLAEFLSLSSIMAIVTCALTMKHYVEENVSQRSCTTIRHAIRMLGTVSETLIFFFLGVVTITTDHEWNWGYVLFTLLFAQLWRGLGILVLTQIINPFRTIPFNFKDQFGLAYGGLRGAVTFALVYTLPDSIFRKKLFVTASIVIIIFTVFVQGISIRPIIKLINVRTTSWSRDTINVEIHTRLMEHTIAGIEDLCGQWSRHALKDKFMRFNRVIRKILIRDNRPESSIVALYKKLELQNAMLSLETISGDISASPSLVSLHEKTTSYKPKKTVSPSDLKAIHELLSKNMYKIRERTVSYTGKHTLPDDSCAREILLRRHTSVRRSLRTRSLRDPEKVRGQKYFSLPLGQSLDSRFTTKKFSCEGENSAPMLNDLPARPNPRQWLRSSSRAKTTLVRLDTLREAGFVEDGQRAVLGRHGQARLSSTPADVTLQAPHQRRGAKDREPDSEEDVSASPPPRRRTAELPERGGGGARRPLLRRPHWKPQDELGDL